MNVENETKVPIKNSLRHKQKKNRIKLVQSRLETIIVSIFNKKTGKHVKVRVFLDSGSNISAISKECALRCDLDFLVKQTLNISTCGNDPVKKTFDTTKTDLFKSDFDCSENLPVNLFVFPKLVGSLRTYELSERQKDFMKIENMQLADKLAGEDGLLKIDILLGQDYLHHFKKGGPIFIPGGSVLFPTWGDKFILAGPVDEETEIKIASDFVPPRYMAVYQILSQPSCLRKMGGEKRISSLIHNVYSCISSENFLDELSVIDSFRNFELLGISPLDYKISPLDVAFNETTILKDGRYEVRLPYIQPQVKQLSTNFFQAFSRLLSGHRRRLKPKFMEEAVKYKKSFDDEIASGILEKVECLGTMDEISQKLAKNPQYFEEIRKNHNNPVCYLPHQAVYKASNGKFRRVHDGAARPYKGGYSLNDCLETGPNLTANILHILLGFRKHENGAKADIEKAFPQVSIAPQDRDALRCLWIEDGLVNVYRFARLPFGLSCSPYILQATLRKHLKGSDVDEQTMRNFVSSIYVDDSVWSEDSIQKLKDRKELYTKLFLKCGMRFRDWNSNVAEAKISWAKQEDREPVLVEKTLGMVWNTFLDTLKINDDRLLELLKKKFKTKRDLWKLVPSIWDPLGLLSPYVLEGRKIISKACKAVKGWDCVLPNDIIQDMLKWCSQFDQIKTFYWPRWVGVKNPKRVQLYGACDASTKALGACVYLVSTTQEDEIVINLVMGKSRNASLDEHSIPRLELASAVLLTNIMSHVRKVYPEIEDKDVVYFSDSADFLFWLYAGHLSWRPFVANQIKKIKASTEVTQWRHIDTTENPADLASRGETLKNMSRSNLWSHGPDYWKTGDLESGKSKLKGFDRHYKDLDMSAACSKELQPAVKRLLDVESHQVVTVASISAMPDPIVDVDGEGFVEKEAKLKLSLSKIDKLLDVSNLKKSSYDHLMLVSEAVRKLGCGVVEKWKKRREIQNKPVSEKFVSEKLSFCKENAEILWIQATQRKYFSEVFQLIENPKARVSSFARSLLVKHTIFLDRDMKVLRCTTRNEKADLSYSSIYPILLPSSVKDLNGKWIDCEFSKKLVLKRHGHLGHAGVPETLANIRSEYWILRGRRFVQKIIKKCVTCKRVSGMPYPSPGSPCLPAFRVSEPKKPFSGVGLDFLGPFNCRDTPRGKTYKAWYVIFVCGSTRAIHLEALRSRKIDDFLNALSRFLSIHGIPECFISDHEGSFKRASESLEQIAKSTRVQKYLKEHRMSWSFYTEKSPNKGGFIERMNSGVKNAFMKTLLRKITSFEDFRTLACHVASIINDRPITYIFSDIQSESMALTPSRLMRGYNLNEPPHLRLYRPADPTEKKITEDFKHLQGLLTKFWKIWNKQYLTDSFERHARDKQARGEYVAPKEGEVVLITEDKLPRRDWRLGRVVEVVVKRGKIREVVVQTLSPGTNLITKLKRAPEKLVPIGVSSEIKNMNPEELVPLEIFTEISDDAILEKAKGPKKYSKKEVAIIEKSLGIWRSKSKIWPPYKPSQQFLDPSSINTGPEQDYIDREGNIPDELLRDWKK